MLTVRFAKRISVTPNGINKNRANNEMAAISWREHSLQSIPSLSSSPNATTTTAITLAVMPATSDLRVVLAGTPTVVVFPPVVCPPINVSQFYLTKYKSLIVLVCYYSFSFLKCSESTLRFLYIPQIR